MSAIYYPGFESLSQALGISTGLFSLIFVLVAIWTLVLKGFALWHAARNHQNRWFIAILILNTIGILEIVYLVWFRKDKEAGRTQSLFNNPVEPAPSA